MIIVEENKKPWEGILDPKQIAADINKGDDYNVFKESDVVSILDQLFGVVPEQTQQQVEPPKPLNSLEEKNDRASVQAFDKFGEQWFSNFWANLPNIHTGAHKLQSVLSKYPIVLLGAGESIIPSLDTLWEHKDKLLIMTVDHSFRYVPFDIVFSLDSQDKVMDKYFTSSWSRAKDKILITQTFANPQIVRKWKRAGGEVLWFHAGYADALPENYREENTNQLAQLPESVKQLGVHCTAYNTALGYLTTMKSPKTLTVGCDYCWSKRYYFDAYPTDNIGPDFIKENNDEKPLILNDPQYFDPIDGVLYTTEKLQHMALITVREFSPSISAKVNTAEDGTQTFEFLKKPGLKELKFVSKPNGILKPSYDINDVISDYFIDNKAEVIEEIREALNDR